MLALCALAPLGLFAMRAFLTPASAGHGTHEQLGLPACGLMKYVGVPCPGCGVTTAVTHAAHGDLGAAFATQPFGALLALAAMLAFPVALIAHFAGLDLYALLGRANRKPVWIALTAVVVAAWLYKIAITLAR